MSKLTWRIRKRCELYHVFRMDVCVVEIDECSPNPCKNGGNCTDMVNGFSCSCFAGYTGEDCSIGKKHIVEIMD